MNKRKWQCSTCMKRYFTKRSTYKHISAKHSGNGVAQRDEIRESVDLWQEEMMSQSEMIRKAEKKALERGIDYLRISQARDACLSPVAWPRTNTSQEIEDYLEHLERLE